MVNTVMSLEKNSNEDWIESKLKLWKRSGYFTDSIEKEILDNSKGSIEIITKYDSLFQRAENVREKMRGLPRNLEKERHSLIERLRNLNEVSAIENEVLLLLEEHRPWMLIIEKNISGWKMHNQLDVLNNLIGRLNNLDPSMIVDAKSISQYFVDPRMEGRIEDEIIRIENRQNKRAIVLNEMEELLKEGGFEINNLSDLSLEKRFEKITKIQNEQKKHLKLKQQINQGIRVFDSELADGFDERRLQLVNLNEQDAFLKLKNEINEMSKVFFSRQNIINKKIRNWREIGIEFENMGSISANELYDWEEKLPDLQHKVDRLIALRERLIKQNEIWADEIDNALLGIRRIDLIDKLEVAVESLENKTDLMDIEFDSFIDNWKQRGYDMQKWIGRYSKNPRETLAELKAFAPVLEEGEILRNRIGDIDAGILLKERQLELSEKLKNSEIELDTIIEIDNEIRLLEKRQIGYYDKLTNEWENIVKNNQALRKIDSTNWTISEFETEISKALETNFDGPTINKMVSSMQKSLKKEFSLLESQGWDVSDLYLQLENSPEKLGEQLPLIRKHISEYERLISRLLVIPWKRNPEKGKLILSQLKMPSELPKIWNMIPSLLREFSTLKIVDEDFEFLPWKPEKNEIFIDVHSTLTPTKIETIQVTEVLDDDEEIILVDDEQDANTKQKVSGNTKKLENKFWEKYSIELEKLTQTIGLNLKIWPIKNNDDVNLWRRGLAESVGHMPRDMRVDRLLRLSLRCIPLDDCDESLLKDYVSLIKSLTLSAKKIHKWTKTRLDYRNSTGGDSLLEDTKKLGIILERIPGPGAKLPLTKDEYVLPQSEDIVGLKYECDSLLKVCF